MDKIYDCLILGGGVAGMTAGLYAKRRGKNVAIVEKCALGGQVNSLTRIENFPSETEIDGLALSGKFREQIKALGVELINDEIVSANLQEDDKILIGQKSQYMAKNVIVATGLSYVELGKNENEFLGRGVSYCVVCDANFYKGKNVCVASKNGSGIKGALELCNVCENVTLLDSADMSIYAQNVKLKNLKVMSNVSIEKVIGDMAVEAVEVVNAQGEKSVVEASALFVELGRKPKTQLFEGMIDLDDKGYIKTDEFMRTNVKGVYAIGDVRNGVLKQIVTACSDGAIAGNLV